MNERSTSASNTLALKSHFIKKFLFFLLSKMAAHFWLNYPKFWVNRGWALSTLLKISTSSYLFVHLFFFISKQIYSKRLTLPSKYLALSFFGRNSHEYWTNWHRVEVVFPSKVWAAIKLSGPSDVFFQLLILVSPQFDRNRSLVPLNS